MWSFDVIIKVWTQTYSFYNDIIYIKYPQIEIKVRSYTQEYRNTLIYLFTISIMEKLMLNSATNMEYPKQL